MVSSRLSYPPITNIMYVCKKEDVEKKRDTSKYSDIYEIEGWDRFSYLHFSLKNFTRGRETLPCHFLDILLLCPGCVR